MSKPDLPLITAFVVQTYYDGTPGELTRQCLLVVPSPEPLQLAMRYYYLLYPGRWKKRENMVQGVF